MVVTATESAADGSSEPELAILVGLQAAGKTTFRERFFADRVVVSKDLMRNVRRK